MRRSQLRLFVGAVRPDPDAWRKAVGPQYRLKCAIACAAFSARLCPKASRHFDRRWRAHRSSLTQCGTDLCAATHPRLGRGNLRGDPCKQGQEGEDNPVHLALHIGSAIRPVQSAARKRG